MGRDADFARVMKVLIDAGYPEPQSNVDFGVPKAVADLVDDVRHETIQECRKRAVREVSRSLVLLENSCMTPERLRRLLRGDAVVSGDDEKGNG